MDRYRRDRLEGAEFDFDSDAEFEGRSSPGKSVRTGPKIMRKERGFGHVAPGARSAVDGARGREGQSLPGELKGRLESTLGADLSAVRVHTGAESNAATRAISARAYTEGQDIHFGSGQYDPASKDGQQLIAHEVAHTVQQSGGAKAGIQTKLEVSTPGDSHEREADAFASAFVSGAASFAISGSASPTALHRDVDEESGDSASVDIIDALNEALSGFWGDDEEAIFERLGRATEGERARVLANGTLMRRLISDLNAAEIRRALSLLRAPLKWQLEAALGGWFEDFNWILQVVLEGSADQVAAVLQDRGLMRRVVSELSSGRADEIILQLLVQAGTALPRLDLQLEAAQPYLDTIIATNGNRAVVEAAFLAYYGDRIAPATVGAEAGSDDADMVFTIEEVEAAEGESATGGGDQIAGGSWSVVALRAAHAELKSASRVTYDKALEALRKHSGEDEEAGAEGVEAAEGTGEETEEDVSDSDIVEFINDCLDGWSNDFSEVLGRIRRASAGEKQLVLGDFDTMWRLSRELDGSQIRLLFSVLGADLYWKVQAVMHGWIEDSNWLLMAIERAPLEQVYDILYNQRLFGRFESELPSDQARQVYHELLAKPGLEPIIIEFPILSVAMKAFELYWGMELGIKDRRSLWKRLFNQDEDELPQWSLDLLRGIHHQLKLLPPGDVGMNDVSELLVDTGAGGYATWDKTTIGIGEDAVGRKSDYGVGSRLIGPASTGDTQIWVDAPDLFEAGNKAILPNGEHTVKAVRVSDQALELETALANDYSRDDPVIPEGGGTREVDWLGAVVRHEIAHAIDGPLVDTSPLTEGMAGWWSGSSFEEWIAQMANPWAAADGSEVTADDKDAIKDRIEEVVDGGEAVELNDGLDDDHAINRLWDSGVPVIEAAKPCAENGRNFWYAPHEIYANGGKRFAMNLYYGKYQTCNEAVYTHRVRAYSVFSKAEFFAELYTVFYEEHGREEVEDEQVGRLVPVDSWRSWIRANVHERGLTPTGAEEAGAGGPAAGMKAGRDSG